MKIVALRVLFICILIGIMLGQSANAQLPPADFQFTASVGSATPRSDVRILTIDSSGHARFTLYNLSATPIVQAESSYTLISAARTMLWKALQDNAFSSLQPTYTDTTVVDGSFACIRIKANGVVQQVILRNSAQPNVERILDSLRTITPPALQILYRPAELFPFTPVDPCTPGTGLMKTGRPDDAVQQLFNQSKSRTGPPRLTSPQAVEPIHPGSAIAYALPFSELVTRGKVKLSSKGEFFGDAVSISVDNTTPQRSPSLDINLYLEFWGPEATPENVANIIGDILSKWAGLQTSDGTPVNMQINHIVRPDAVVAPGTPGYHQIKLVTSGTDGAFRSYVHGMNEDFRLNEGVGTGQWLVNGVPGTYAHEAGHLLGFEDQYDDYVKQTNGDWYSKRADTRILGDEAFADIILKREPPQDRTTLLDFLGKNSVYSLTRDKHKTDLMADKKGTVSQEDIDFLAAQAGLLVKLKPGDVLVNRASENQNLVITHGDEMFVRAGQTRTLNGLYGACIDFHRLPPSSGDLFDLAPPLASWNGSSAPGEVAALARYLDSTRLYCGNEYAAQAALWRITDNTAFGDLGDGILLQAGIQPGDRATEFPRLTGISAADSAARLVIPDELYIGSIEPRFADGKIGARAPFKGKISQPSIDGVSSSFSWFARGPNDSTVAVSAAGDSASFIPDRTGIYVVGLRISASDSSRGLRTFDATQKGYVIVPDHFTETFEHATIADKLPWRTYGNAPWTITTTSPQTGVRSAQSGTLTGNQADTIFSALEVRVSLPRDTVITFSVRTATNFLLDRFEWRVDGRPVVTLYGYSDWKILTYDLPAGEHTLAWVCVQFTAVPAKIWVDNIFFPSNSVVSTVEEEGAAPMEFQLMQNYPNPFNPTTTIRYALPRSSYVSLTVFNTLGQQVAELVNGEVGAGYHDVQFNATNLASGVYFYRIQVRSLDPSGGRASGSGTTDVIETRKLLLLR